MEMRSRVPVAGNNHRHLGIAVLMTGALTSGERSSALCAARRCRPQDTGSHASPSPGEGRYSARHVRANRSRWPGVAGVLVYVVVIVVMVVACGSSSSGNPGQSPAPSTQQSRTLTRIQQSNLGPDETIYHNYWSDGSQTTCMVHVFPDGVQSASGDCAPDGIANGMTGLWTGEADAPGTRPAIYARGYVVRRRSHDVRATVPVVALGGNHAA
jgi:hypothetical protein